MSAEAYSARLRHRKLGDAALVRLAAIACPYQASNSAIKTERMVGKYVPPREKFATTNAALGMQLAARETPLVRQRYAPLRLLSWRETADDAMAKHKVAVQRNGHSAASIASTGGVLANPSNDLEPQPRREAPRPITFPRFLKPATETNCRCLSANLDPSCLVCGFSVRIGQSGVVAIP